MQLAYAIAESKALAESREFAELEAAADRAPIPPASGMRFVRFCAACHCFVSQFLPMQPPSPLTPVVLRVRKVHQRTFVFY